MSEDDCLCAWRAIATTFTTHTILTVLLELSHLITEWERDRLSMVLTAVLGRSVLTEDSTSVPVHTTRAVAEPPDSIAVAVGLAQQDVHYCNTQSQPAANAADGAHGGATKQRNVQPRDDPPGGS